jgi:ELWxxDGT repeat protein
VKDINPGPASSAPYELADIDGVAYFAADDGVHGRELWRSDGTPDGTFLVCDVQQKNSGHNPSGITNVNGQIFFTANDGVVGEELWVTDGTAEGTHLVRDIALGSASSGPRFMIKFNGRLFFTAAANGQWSLWSSDGTAAGTSRVKDGLEIPGSALVGVPTKVVFADKLYFPAADTVGGWELWLTDGTSAGTSVVKDLNPGSLASVSSMGNSIVSTPGALFFSANDRLHGAELWKLAPDFQPPSIESAHLEFETMLAVRVGFSEPINTGSISPSDLQVVNLTTGQQLGAQNVIVEQNGQVITFVLPANLPDGDYRFSLESGAVTDQAGNALAVGVQLEGSGVFILAGDANRDRKVDVADLGIVASNWQQSPRTFSLGDFDYSGTVDVNDLGILASHWQQQLAAPAAPARIARFPLDPVASLVL